MSLAQMGSPDLQFLFQKLPTLYPASFISVCSLPPAVLRIIAFLSLESRKLPEGRALDCFVDCCLLSSRIMPSTQEMLNKYLWNEGMNYSRMRVH